MSGLLSGDAAGRKRAGKSPVPGIRRLLALALWAGAAAVLFSACGKTPAPEASTAARTTETAKTEETTKAKETAEAAAEAGKTEETVKAVESSGAAVTGTKEAEMDQETGTEKETEKASEMTAAEGAGEVEAAFWQSEITDDIFARIRGKSYRDDCTVPREELRYLHALHKNLEGETLEGEMIVNAAIAEDVLEILKELYLADYPIERMVLVDEYGADDETSMRANNSSAFNFRFISHTTRVSKHGYGLAVDINTLYNPYTKMVDGKRIIEPATGEPYLDRSASFPYKIEEGDLCCRLFTERSFVWGGSWTDRKDYQHFELPDEAVRALYPEW